LLSIQIVARADESGLSFWLPGLFGSFGDTWRSDREFLLPSLGERGRDKTFLVGERFEAVVVWLR
jgi:hypothetical protein